MKKLSIIIVFLVLLSFSPSLIGCAKAPGAEQPPATTAAPIELKISTQEIEASFLIKDVLVPWAKEIEAGSNGRVKITFYNNAVLAKPPEQYDAAVKGIADISLQMATYLPGRFPLSETIQLPFLGITSAKAGGELFEELLPKYLKDEYKEVKFQFAWTLPPTRFHTNKAVQKLDDLKGMKIMVTGAAGADVIKALGATPVSVAVPERFSALERGVAEGQIAITELIWIFKMYEISKHTTLVAFNSVPFLVVMNQNTWGKLPKDVQGVFEKTNTRWWSETGKLLDTVEEKLVGELKTKGHNFYTLSPDEEGKWKNLAKPVHDSYMASLKAKGLAGQEVYDNIAKLVTSR